MEFWTDIIAVLNKHAASINNSILNSDYHPMINTVMAKRVMYYMCTSSLKSRYSNMLIIPDFNSLNMQTQALQIHCKVTKTSNSVFCNILFLFKGEILIVETIRMHIISIHNRRIYSRYVSRREVINLEDINRALFCLYLLCSCEVATMYTYESIYDNEIVRHVLCCMRENFNARRVDLFITDTSDN